MRLCRVIVVDCDNAYSQSLCRELGRQGCLPIFTDRPNEAVQQAATIAPRIILLELQLGATSGIHILHALRKHPKTAAIPVIMMTMLHGLDDLIASAENDLGCGPMWRKGGDIRGLVERIQREHQQIRPAQRICRKARLLASSITSSTHLLRRGPMLANLLTRKISVSGQEIPNLAPRRFELLCSLMRASRAVPQRELLATLWGADHDRKAVQMSVSRLRSDLRPYPFLEIQTSRDGYSLVIGPSNL